jgi:hypothetical protein
MRRVGQGRRDGSTTSKGEGGGVSVVAEEHGGGGFREPMLGQK